MHERHILDSVLLALLIFVVACRASVCLADWYATSLYPVVSAMLSRLSSVFPFSLDELLELSFVVVVFLIAIRGARRKERWHKVLLWEVRWLVFVYVWFYIGWGINYSRSLLSRRLETPVAAYDETAFKAFLSGYVSQLNSLHDNRSDVGLDIHEDIRSFYSSLPAEAGLCKPHWWQAPKDALASGLFSKVGVTGSMGPFLGESLLNSQTPENERPFVAAHEFAHLMGVSSEAEANFWAFRYCEASCDPAVRYSGYLSLLGNILRNARSLLLEEDYMELVESIGEGVREEFNSNREYWTGRYSKVLGKMQDVIYNAYLKSNGIQSGTKNYDEVLSLLMTDFKINIDTNK